MASINQATNEMSVKLVNQSTADFGITIAYF